MSDRLAGDPRYARRILKLYRRIHSGKPVADQPLSPVHTALKLSGVVKVANDGVLHVRNRIYETVFTAPWAKRMTPPNRPVRWMTGSSLVLLLIAAVLGYQLFFVPPQPAPNQLVFVLGGGVTMELIQIPAGEFTMGSPQGEVTAFSNELPQHNVRIGQPFYMGKYEVTVGQFRQFVEAAGYRTDAEKGGQEWEDGKKGGYTWDSQEGDWGWREWGSWRSPGFEQTDSHPVVLVSWNDAMAFCDWLSVQTDRKVRLPTEAEWEYACRADSQTRFSFGDKDQDLDRFAWYFENSEMKTHPVGTKEPNAFGLYDMHGNVWEWCADVWHDNYEGAPNDGSAWTRGEDQSARVLRGGSWNNNERRNLRCAVRGRASPVLRWSGSGFRVAVLSGLSVGTP